MPWIPELFSAPVLARFEEKRQHELTAVPFFDGLVAGELAPLVESFAGEPEVHHPVRGRIKGVRAFASFVAEMNAWLDGRNASVEDVEHVVAERHAFEEVVLHLDGGNGRVDLPVAVVADMQADRRMDEVRIYFSSWPLSGRHANRPPLLQADPGQRPPEVVAAFQRALAAGDVDAIVALFEPDAYVREPGGVQYVHRGHEALRAFYGLLFSNDGGIPLEHCAVVDDGHACALEYNEVRWGRTELPPQAGLVVHVRGQSGKLAAVRIYDDVERPIEPLGEPRLTT